MAVEVLLSCDQRRFRNAYSNELRRCLPSRRVSVSHHRHRSLHGVCAARPQDAGRPRSQQQGSSKAISIDLIRFGAEEATLGFMQAAEKSYAVPPGPLGSAHKPSHAHIRSRCLSNVRMREASLAKGLGKASWHLGDVKHRVLSGRMHIGARKLDHARISTCMYCFRVLLMANVGCLPRCHISRHPGPADASVLENGGSGSLPHRGLAQRGSGRLSMPAPRGDHRT